MAKFVLTAQLVIAPPRNLAQISRQIQSQLSNIQVNVSVRANLQSLNQTNQALNVTQKNAKAAHNSVSDLFKSLSGAARRFGAIAIVTGVFLSLGRAIKSSISDAIEFERELVNLSQVTGNSVKELKGLSGEVTKLATTWGVAGEKILKTGIVLAQAGLSADKTKAALEVLAKTELASSFDDITSTTEGAIAILSQFKKEAALAGGEIAYLEQSLSSINEVSKKYAVESADLVAVIRRAGGAFEASGGSLNELLALFTSVRATTRESAETIATGLRTIFTRVQRVETIRQLQELGISLQDAEGKFVGSFEAFKRIATGLQSLDSRDFRFAAIVEELGGFRQISKVIPLIKQFGLAQQVLNTAQSSGDSLTQDAIKAQSSLANQIARVREEFQALIRQFVDSSAFRSLLDLSLQLAKSFINVAKALEPILPMIIGLAGLKLSSGIFPALSSMVNKRNNGGRIHKFASGGFVPGSGNRDTVPAMLMPGEFVIRKSSAQKLGADKLNQLNAGGSVQRFAGGGIVENLMSPSASGQVGILSLNATGLESHPAVKLEMNDSLSQKTKDKITELMQTNKNIQFGKNIPVRTFGIDRGGEAKKDLDLIINRFFEEGMSRSVSETANSIAPALGIKLPNPVIPPNEYSSFAKSLNESVSGVLFEGLVSAISSGGDMSKIDKNRLRSFDFIGPINQASKLFMGGESLNTDEYKYKDAKQTGFRALDIQTKIWDQAYAERGGASSAIQTETRLDALFQRIKDKPEVLNNLNTFGGLSTKELKEVSSIRNEVDAIKFFRSELGADPDKTTVTRADRAKTKASIFVLKKYYDEWLAKQGVQQFANGGMPKGTDTVPAMLTPGEFVVNKAAAQQIGYDNLNHMNKSGKPKYFAKGGAVQYFANGGPVQALAPTRGGVPMGPNAAKETSEFIEMQNIFARVSQAADGTKTNLELINETAKELTNIFGTLENSTQAIIAAHINQATQLELQEKASIAAYKAQLAQTKRVEDFGKKLSGMINSAQNFVFITTAISTATFQLSTFSDSIKDAITETTVLASTLIGFGGTMADFAASVVPATVKTAILTTVVSGLTAVATTLGVSITAVLAPFAILGVAIAAAVATFYYLRAQARALSDSINKSADEILQNSEQGKGGSESEFITKKLKAVAVAQEQYWFSTKAAKDQEIAQMNMASKALYSLATSSITLDQNLANIDKDKSLNKQQQTARSIGLLTDSINQSISDVEKAKSILIGIRSASGSSFDESKLDGVTKKTFETAQKAIVDGAEKIGNRFNKADEIIAIGVEDILKDLDGLKLAGKTGPEIIAQIKNMDIGKDIDKVLSAKISDAQQKANSNLLNAAATKDLDLMVAAFDDGRKMIRDVVSAGYDYQKTLEAQAQAESDRQKGSAALNKFLEDQKNVFMQANGAIKFFAQQLSDTTRMMSALESTVDRLGGGITKGASNPITGIGNLNEIIDPNIFKKDIGRVLEPLGGFGDSVGKNLGSTADILDKAKKKLLNVRFGNINIMEVINDVFDQSSISADLRTAMSSLIQDAIKPSTEGASMITASEFENIFAPLIATSEPFRQVVEGLINSQAELTSANAAYLTEINKLKQQEIDGRKRIVESDIRLSERLSEARDKSLTFQEKENMRNQRRAIAAGNRGGLANRFSATANSLRDLQDRIRKSNSIGETAELQKEQADLTLSFANMKSVIEELTDQTDKANDVMAEIGKERAKRDLTSKYIQNFVTGNAQDRRGISRQFQGLQAVAGAGSFQVLNAEMRGQVSSLLDELAAVDDRFKNLKKTILFNDAVRMGIAPNVAGALANATPKEQMLIDELRAIAAEEKQFQQLLNDNTAAETKNLTDKMQLVVDAIDSFPLRMFDSIQSAMNEARAEEEKIAKNKIQFEADRAKAAIEEAKKTEAEKAIREKTIDARTAELIKSIDNLAKQMAAQALQEERGRQFMDSRGTKTGLSAQPINGAYAPEPIRQKNAAEYEERKAKERANRLNTKAKGGPIYASKGAYIMKPKGVDTVPAMLQPGEFVMRKSAVDKYGLDTMSSMNKGIYAAEGMHVPKAGYTTPKYKKDKNGRYVMGADGKQLLADNEDPYITPNYKKNKDGRIIIDKQGKPEREYASFSDTKPKQSNNFDANQAYNNEAKINVALARQSKEAIMSRLISKPKDVPPPTINKPSIAKSLPVVGNKPIQPNNVVNAPTISNDKVLKELGGTYGSGRHHDPQKSLAISEKRQAEEIRKRQIRMGQIDPKASRREAINNRLQERQNNINNAIEARKERALPSYMRGQGLNEPQNNQQMGRPNIPQAFNPQRGGANQNAGMNMDPIMQVKTTFDNLAGVLNNMTMTHQVNVDGTLNLGGVNNTEIAESIRDYLGEFIASEVKKVVGNQGFKA